MPGPVRRPAQARSYAERVNHGDLAFGIGMFALGAFVCLAFLLFGMPILLVAWLLGVPMVIAGVISTADGVWGRQGAPESRASPVAREQVIPAETKRDVWARDGGTCVLCGAVTDLRFSHVIPGGDGGDSPANLRVMCGSCHRELAAPSRLETAVGA